MQLRFSIGRIPVEVHPSHLLVSGLIAYSLTQSAGTGGASTEWPYRALSDPNASDHLTTLFAFIGIWMGIVFVSVLVHELGHAIVARIYGYRPTIALVWLGGHTNPNAGETIPWHKDVLLTLAGPGFGLLLAAAAFGSYFAFGTTSEALGYVLKLTAAANLYWSILNLLPVFPLDGGRVLSALLVRGFGRKGFIFGQGLSLAIAFVGVAYGAARGDIWILLLSGFFGMTSFGLLSRALKGEPVEAPRHPFELALEGARALYREGRLEQARAHAEQLLHVEPKPSDALLSQTHHLLGWIALKDGRGRVALDHFAKVDRMPVEPHALAAAFSLASDDERALPMWELAWKGTRDRTVLHEYAGTLLRLRRAEALNHLPDLDLVLAYTCAVRLLTIRGDFARAGELAEEGVTREGETGEPNEGGFTLAYDGACARARAGDVDGAMRLLERAGELGFKDWDYAASDSDLERLHRDARFGPFLARVKETRAG